MRRATVIHSGQAEEVAAYFVWGWMGQGIHRCFRVPKGYDAAWVLSFLVACLGTELGALPGV